eukprot:1353821-Prymnesium_polylepis.1
MFPPPPAAQALTKSLITTRNVNVCPGSSHNHCSPPRTGLRPPCPRGTQQERECQRIWRFFASHARFASSSDIRAGSVTSCTGAAGGGATITCSAGGTTGAGGAAGGAAMVWTASGGAYRASSTASAVGVASCVKRAFSMRSLVRPGVSNLPSRARAIATF